MVSAKSRRVIRRAGLGVLIGSLAILLVGGIVDRSWTALALVALMAGSLLIERRNSSRDRRIDVDPRQIPSTSIQQALSSSDGRISAIKVLRERHPGLGLRDAKDLVEEQIRRGQAGGAQG